MPKTVLIVDDVAFVRKTLNEVLTEAHYQVIGEAADGAEAVNLYMKLRPDVVTMDVVMPQMSGIDATRKILKYDKDAKVVIISAMGQENLVMEAINVGAKDYLLKPFSGAEVVKTIERALADDSGKPSRPSPREHKIG
ncbi:MAG: response regulator [Oligoflexia bacterium]|nr:response regulator [Oligoflexia bacterium]